MTKFYQAIGAFFSMITSIFTSVEHAVTKTLPEAGDLLYSSTSMATDAIRSAKYEQLIEYAKKANLALGKPEKVTPEQLKAIEARMVY